VRKLRATPLRGGESKLRLEAIMRGPFLLGRLMFGGYFILSGINHFMKTQELAQYPQQKKFPNRMPQ
jgi:uncharacterized membrane protein YphA (DoxX/SURF4 family)